MRPISDVRTNATTAPPAPMTIAQQAMIATRRSTGRYSGGALMIASAGSSDGATGNPSAAFSGVCSPSGTSCFDLGVFELAQHRRRREVDLRGAQPAFEQLGEPLLIVM